jgi:ketosteroid isomerase-like protein
MPLQCKGIAEYRKTWELFFEHNDAGPGSFDIVELQVIASDSVAYAHALVKIFDSTLRVTIGLREEKDRWLIAQEHHSCPIDLDSRQSGSR